MSEPNDPARATAAGEMLAWAGLFGATLIIYASLWPAVTGDMTYYLVDWYRIIRAEGPIGAFAQPFSNYTPPYLYLLAAASALHGLMSEVGIIKLLSVAGVGALAVSVCRLLQALKVKGPHLKAAFVFLIPSVLINAAGLGQCDAFWSAACVMAVAEMIKGRSVAALLWFGLAIAFKAQAIFLAPFIAMRLIADRTPLHLWAIPGLVFAAAMLPAWLAGWPALDLATIYLRQTEWGPGFISNAANPWSVVQHVIPAQGIGFLWAGHVAALAASVAFIILLRKRPMRGPELLAAALLSAMILPWLLPKMHERFFFLAEILSFAFALVRRDRASISVAILVQSATLLALGQLLGGSPWLAPLGSILNLAAMTLITRSLLSPKEDAVEKNDMDVPLLQPAL